jgi:hypothetical protein
LTIRALRSPLVRTFFPANSQPFEIFEDGINRSLCRSLDIGILNSQNKNSVMMFGKDVVEEGGSSISDMKKTGGGGSKTNTHTGDH